MFIPHPLPLLLALAQGTGPLQPDEMLSIPGGPEVAVLRTAASEVVSLRVSVPLREEGAEAGAGYLLAMEADERMQELARRIGARAEAERTPQAIVYRVSGPVTELDFLGWILREGMGPPPLNGVEAMLARLRVEHDRRLETPRGVLAARLRAALVPSAASVFATAGSLERMDRARLADLWDRTHLRGMARVVAAGGIPSELVLLLVNDLGLRDAPVGAPVAAGEETGSPLPDPEVIRHWVAEAYPFLDGDEAGALVAARFLGEEYETVRGDFEVGVEIWETGGRTALVVTGAAYGRSQEAMEGRLERMFEDAAARISEDDIERLSDALRTDVLMSGRTPWGLTEIVGQAWDAGRGPGGTDQLLTALDGIGAIEVIGLLGALARATPLREELHP